MWLLGQARDGDGRSLRRREGGREGGRGRVRTSGLRMGSPPGPGRMNFPFKASRRPPSSLSATTCLRQNSKYWKRGVRSWGREGGRGGC